MQEHTRVQGMIFVLGLVAGCGSGKTDERGSETGGTSGSQTGSETGATGTGAVTSGDGATSTSGGPGGSSSASGDSQGTGTSGAETGDPGTGGGSTTANPGTGSGTTTGGDDTSGTGTTTGGNMLTECNGCTCDPQVSYCQVASSQTMDPPPEHPSGACPFIAAGSYDYGCVAYSPECGEDPSCDCVPVTDPLCGCMDAGDFLFVNCDYP